MTIDEAIKYNLDIADGQDKCADISVSEHAKERMRECAADHRQLAEWLMELKDLRAEQNDQYVFIHELMSELKEAKRLLKSATNVLSMFIPCDEDYNCSECIKQRQNCDYDDSFKWRYLDEALKLIGGSENENH